MGEFNKKRGKDFSELNIGIINGMHTSTAFGTAPLVHRELE
jgi:hypothetical protein